MHGMAVLLALQSCMMLTSLLAEQHMILQHPVISSVMLMINLRLGRSCLTWTLASLVPLRLTPHCCTHHSLVPAVQMSANQVSFLPALGYPKLLPQVRNATLYVSCTLKGLQSNPNARDV